MRTPDDPLDDIEVVVGHPFGNARVALARWIAAGPGPRPFVQPIRAYSKSTGEELPLTAIPLVYRNDRESRDAIRAGLLEHPWPQWTHPNDLAEPRDPLT